MESIDFALAPNALLCKFSTAYPGSGAAVEFVRVQMRFEFLRRLFSLPGYRIAISEDPCRRPSSTLT